MLKKIISGGQTGADVAALVVAQQFGIVTGGMMPKGFKTLLGPRPDYADLFGMTEHRSASYQPRTYENVKNSDATLRLAYNFNSSGEVCTYWAIKKLKKPYLDVYLINPQDPKEVATWLLTNNVQILNVAGNSEQTSPGIFVVVKDYLSRVLLHLTDLDFISEFNHGT